MEGQWIRILEDRTTIMLDLEHVGARVKGTLYISERDDISTHLYCFINTENTGNYIELDAFLHDQAAVSSYLDGIGILHNNEKANNSGKLKLKFLENGWCALSLKNSIKNLEIDMHAANKNEHSSIQMMTTVTTWTEFKNYVEKLNYRDFIYRGQPFRWPLKTSFHRSTRSDLMNYVTELLPDVRASVSAETNQIIDDKNRIQFGSFLHLIQHHGLPTPQLDWSRSPFVAAFFAFNSEKTIETANEPVRIFIFDETKWRNKFVQSIGLLEPRPHLSVSKQIPLMNPRAIRQQSIMTTTNIEDIEGYITSIENQMNEKFLYAIDLPMSEKKSAMNSLNLMGINSSTMFPGLDGICRHYKSMYFGA